MHTGRCSYHVTQVLFVCRWRPPPANHGVRRKRHQQLVWPWDRGCEKVHEKINQSGGSDRNRSHLTHPVNSPQVLKFVDPQTQCMRYYTPRGRFVHVPPAGPRCDWATDFGEPWWKDERYKVGRLSAKTRWIRVINTLTSQEQRLEVSSQTPTIKIRPLWVTVSKQKDCSKCRQMTFITNLCPHNFENLSKCAPWKLTFESLKH